MASIVVSGDTSGAVTLEAPAIAGTTTLTLPTTSGTIVTTGGAASLTTSGNLTFTGTGNRITGDFTNATIANRVLFQTSTANQPTRVGVIPNGTGAAAALAAINNSDPTNASFMQIAAVAAEAQITSTISGTGTYLPMTFSTGGSERLRIDTSGNVGIGTNSPNTRLQLGGATNKTIRIDTATSNAGFYGVFNTYTIMSANRNPTDGVFVDTGKAASAILCDANVGDGNITFQTTASNNTAPTERMRIDSSGNVGIGTTSPGGKFAVKLTSIDTKILVENGASTNGLRLTTTNDAFSVYRNFEISSSNTIFYTDGTERMRITSSGNLLVGTTTEFARVVSRTTSSAAIPFWASSNYSGDLSQPGMRVDKFDNNTTTSQVFVNFSVNNNTTACGQINANGAGAAAFGSWSDSRLKENIVDLPPQLENICALRPVEFDYIESQGGGHQIGFIAQEMQEVYPDAVGVRQPDDMLTITGWSKTEARLVKAIQELNAKVEAQAAEIAALKGVK